MTLAHRVSFVIYCTVAGAAVDPQRSALNGDTLPLWIALANGYGTQT